MPLMSYLQPVPAAAPAPQEVVEKRTYERLCTPPLYVSGVWADVYDISLGGICLRLKERLNVGDQFDLILTDGLYHFTMEARAEVIWSRASRSGLRWVGLDEAQQVWLSARFDNWRREGAIRQRQSGKD